MRGSKNKHNKEPPAITTRVLKRVNLIIEAVQQHIVIEDLTKLLKVFNILKHLAEIVCVSHTNIGFSIVNS